jgi:Delta14-sterol reductase
MTDTPPNLARDAGDGKTLVKSGAALNPRTKHYEFGGPFGALFVTTVVPFVTYALYFSCSEHAGGCPPQNYNVLLTRLVDAVTDPEWWKGLWDTKAALIYLGWYAFCVISWAILPGDWIEGVELRTGEKKKYKINGTWAQ